MNLFFTQKTDEKELKSVLLAIEQDSEHPLAEAVVKHLKAEAVIPVMLNNVQSITGMGASAIYKGRRYFLGNAKLMHEQDVNIAADSEKEIEKLQSRAKTVVMFAEEKMLVGIIAIADKVKATSHEAIQKLQDAGIDVYMLTGDNRQTAAAIANEVGLKNYEAEVMPSDKASFVIRLQQQGKTVAMVGDGINDSHALAQADVGIAMGKGSDIAMDVAKMVLMTSDLKSIPKALQLSGKTITTIRQNLFWAFIYNIIGIPIAAGVLFPINGFLLDPMIAGAAMALSSVSVVANSLRLKFSLIS
jgi:P-type Cu2+ transporter